MQQILDLLSSLLKFHKKKFLVAFLSFLFFAITLFPFGDLSDLVTVQVSQLTKNQVYLQFEDMGISIFPSPGISLSQVQLDTPTLPALNVSSLSISPSIAALLSFKPGFSAHAEGFLKGDIFLSYKEGDKSKNSEMHTIELEIEDLDLAQINKLAKLPVKLKGLANFEANIIADSTFTNQPEATIHLTANKINLPPSTVPTAFGPMSLPALKLSNVVLKGQLVNGDFVIDEGTIGSKKDPLSGRLKGRLAIKFRKERGNIKPSYGAYELKVELTTLKSGQDKFGLFLGFIDNKYKTKTNTGFLYQFKVSGTRFGTPPRFSPLRKF